MVSGLRGCSVELVSQHYNSAQSCGVVSDNEILVFAVTDESHVDPYGKLTSKAFPSKRLQKEEASLARQSFTKRIEFEAKVIAPALDRGEPYKGVATVLAGKVREIKFNILNSNHEYALCIQDKVEETDFDGHAVVCYSEHVSNLTGNQNRIGRLKEVIRMDLAAEFSVLRSICDVFPASCATSETLSPTGEAS